MTPEGREELEQVQGHIVQAVEEVQSLLALQLVGGWLCGLMLKVVPWTSCGSL